MVLRLGSRGNEVKEIQEFLGLFPDGIFGKVTEQYVIKYQRENGLKPDGIIGNITLQMMKYPSTDLTERVETASNGLVIHKNFLPKGEYKEGPKNKEYIFLHHTAGWNDPYNTIRDWKTDTRGPVGTEFVLGGASIKGDNYRYDGELVHCIPNGGYAWHLGTNGSPHMHRHSVGIEMCNFGYLTNGRTYTGTLAHSSQVVTLKEPFRGHRYWHRYSSEQLNTLRMWLLYIAERDEIDIRKGLPELIKENGAKAFEFNSDAYYGRIKGVWAHVNTRRDKFDVFPQQELMDMLVSL